MQSITPAELAQQLADGETYVLLDVREPEELEICSLDGAVHIPMGEIPSRVEELDPEARIVCVCHHGVRSASVAGFLASRDFDEVINLSGGVDRWAMEVDPAMQRY